MSDVPIISTISVAETDKVLATLTVAFAADPMVRWMYPEADVYLHVYPKFLKAFCGSGIVDGTAFRDESFGGACIWMSPGSEADYESLIAVNKAAIPPERLETLGAINQQMEQYHPQDEPLWYLPCIGVDANAQGRGIGSALMKHALRFCDEQGTRAYLESSNPANISLYERHGFEAMGRIQVGSAPQITPMIRDRR